MTFAATTAAEKHTLTLCVLMNSSIYFDDEPEMADYTYRGSTGKSFQIKTYFNPRRVCFFRK